MSRTLFDDEPVPRVTGIVPRDYQFTDIRESFRLWDSGTVGVLTRLATGLGKTICSCLKFRKWMDRGPEYKCLVLSYEQQLVWQFAEEIEDVLGITPGIEMGSNELEPGSIPPITVATRQSLMCHELATGEQRSALGEYGFTTIGCLTKRAAMSAIKALQSGQDPQTVGDGIEEFNQRYECDHERTLFTRLTKFDWRWNWLLVLDEAHKYKLGHKTCGHVIEWFNRNPNSRRSGITATPKRSDKVSIGRHLFPGVAIDYPLRAAVRDGYAVPYVQKFVQVEGVDFKRLREESRGSQEKWDAGLDKMLNTEEQLASLCEPMLDMVGQRRTLIFSPSVAMAENVSAYLNARAECECHCGTKRWFPRGLIGDGAKCEQCGEWQTSANIVSGEIVAQCVHGGINAKVRRDIYRSHQSGEYQFLSVCSLCKEGYNDRDIAAVAVFRPVSKEAASLAEQMKGRGSRPLKGCIDGLATPTERLAAIRASIKPDCLIIDMVGISSLDECASTVEIYGEGLPDDVLRLAEKYAAEGGMPNVMEALERAERDVAEEKEKQRLEREAEAERRRQEAERRSKLDPTVTYSTHEVGSRYMDAPRDPLAATSAQWNKIRFLGIELVGWEPTKRQASRIIGLLESGMPAEEVAYQCGIKSTQWMPSRPSVKQVRYMQRLGIGGAQQMTPKQASEAIDRVKNPRSQVVAVAMQAIESAKTGDELTAAAKRLLTDRKEFTDKEWVAIVEAGKRARQALEF